MVQISQAPTGQNCMCIVYLDQRLPAHHRHRLNVLLKQAFHYIRIFTDVGSFSDYLISSFVVGKLVIIVSGDDAKSICQNIENDKEFLRDPLVYELQFGKTPLKSGLSQDRRFHIIDPLIDKIEADLNEYSSTTTEGHHVTLDENILDSKRELFPLGIHEFVGRQRSFCYPSTEELKFILFQSFIEVLLGITYDNEDEKNEALERMWTSFREDLDYQTDLTYLQSVEAYRRTYSQATSIETYTRASFFFRAVNKAFRYEDLEKIFDFQPFIAHIHQQLQNLRIQQRSQTTSSQQMFRRGKKLPASVLQQLEDNKGKLVSINGFLSTTAQDDVADLYAGTGANRPGYQSVIFEISVDHTIDIKRPYADICTFSAIPADEEVLFFMGFVWRIEAVDREDGQPIKVKLKLSSDMDPAITERFNELADQCTFFRLGKILHELGEYKKAINFYHCMFNSQPELSDKKVLANIHYHMAISAFEDGSYPQALERIQQAESLINEATRLGDIQPILAEDTSFSIIHVLINKGLIYQKMKEYKCAKQSFEEALEKDGPTNDKAYAHYHLGVLEHERGHHQIAVEQFSQAFRLTTDQALKNTISEKLHLLDEILRTSNDHPREPANN